ncbi:carbohydrate ABC transporter permease [Bariatricus massiliensis]|uniref:Sugar ABC transporter permease n=1 Tax=Bariatricus massiliensis TaxID=1745713 RepID=A0ABS8DGD3_9FIRM|nr:sugar ABC transporter permease [Bariatricus massiliensis]MCB7304356.1 sugar ABC transporter permease [Bariatricus massiliensis]MCB7375007.1 sugar ABC transporter permease [Bariatricus massiliensis]MCB7387466.1 sugar ABC transporter permease [Bariatricus massiliensis]MCB7411628.1 sugar ABC transporter permease [Bariatricus massiliensis]
MRSRSRKIKKTMIPYLFIGPALLINLVFFCLPFIQSLLMSFFDWPLLGEKIFVGLENYKALFTDGQFGVSLVFTFKYTLLVTPALFIMAFILALLIDGKFKGVTLFRTIYFSPVVISMTSCSLIWLWIYNDLYGILNYIFLKLGVIDKSVLWMGTEKTSLPAIVFMITWKMAGFSMLIILAAFQSVDMEIYESADIDGASKIQRFFRITLPIIRPQVGLAMIMSVIGSVLAFEQFLIMTKGGPTETTTTLVHYIYNTSFKYYKFGYGSAMTMVLLAIMLLLSLLQMRMMKDPTE